MITILKRYSNYKRFVIGTLLSVGLFSLAVFLLYPDTSHAPTDTSRNDTPGTFSPTAPTITAPTSTPTTTTVIEKVSEEIMAEEELGLVETATDSSSIEPEVAPTTTTTKEPRQFTERFDETFTIKEVGDPTESSSANWWVSSGGYFFSRGGVGSTIVDELPLTDERYQAYAKSNPLDTDDGLHPQNIFRLVQKDTWENFSQEAYFKIVGNNFSDSRNRNASNGLLFFNRYVDEDNLYYTGIRVDGYVTIKKKISGTYYTLVYQPLFNIGEKYNEEDKINLLPSDQWIGLRSVVKTNPNGTVTIELYIDRGKTGSWQLVAKVVDDGARFGGAVFTSGHGGIRTDFMDVQFDNYLIREL